MNLLAVYSFMRIKLIKNRIASVNNSKFTIIRLAIFIIHKRILVCEFLDG
ncbi:hypothetical protein NARC_140077 [Candidatus Nitrosocosmicus arcticus]|uniref:Uncharacterized protein n=1 Tax=Candidatus Nitrosocosmicus arcticus TaxID=2035267 RepID=A0A557SSQ6_9ARCH|nr:hypothetical protein NARC_140077 [Candidatus Nitrosocosmicus arcticus]